MAIVGMPTSAASRRTACAPTSMEEFFFDLRGYSVVENALSTYELAAINGWIDARKDIIRRVCQIDPIDYMPILPSIPLDGMHVQSYHNGEHNKPIGHADDGVNLQFPYESGGIFDSLIDHPSWIGRVQHYLGPTQPYLHELFINLRGTGGYIGCHGGGPMFTKTGVQLRSPWGAAVRRDEDSSHDPHRGTHRGHRIVWAVPYLSIIVALTDIGAGDGATVIVPASHKSMVGHPFQEQMVTAGDDVEGAEEMHLDAGSALVFQDSLIHGAVARTNKDGWRRTLCFRYLPQWCSKDRFGYQPSQETMDRLTPARRELLTQRADTNDSWGQTHLKLAAAAIPPFKMAVQQGHSYSRI